MTASPWPDRTPAALGEDRELAARLVAVMEDPAVLSIDTEVSSTDDRWEFAMVLIAAARRAGWSPTRSPSQGS